MESALTPLEKTEKLLYRFDHPKAGTWERVDLDIRRNRMGWGTVFLKDASGIPRKNCEIRVRQKSHDFQFGCNAFKLGNFADPGKNAAYEEFFKRVFNEAVVPFLWDSTEPEQGKFRFAADSPAMDRRPPADLLIDWCEQNRIAPKGHWMFCDNFVPRWLPCDSRDVMILVEKRIAELAERYASRVRKWDVVNESFTYHPRKNPAIGDAAVPEDYVRQIVFRQTAFKTAGQNFAHHAEVVSGRESVPRDIKLAIRLFIKAVRCRNDHGSDRAGALYMAVIISFNASDRGFDIQQIPQLIQ